MMCQVHTLVHTCHYSRLEKLATPLATQEKLPRIYCTCYLSLCIRTSDSSHLEKRKEKSREDREERTIKESEKGEEKKRKEKTRRGSKERKGIKNVLADPY